MTYIVRYNPMGFPEMATENVFDNYEDAKEFALAHARCNGNECEYKIYEARNEFDAKRKLLNVI